MNKKKLAVIWFFIFAFNSLCSAVLISLIGATWSAMDAQGKFMVIIAVGANFSNTIGAFLYNYLKKIDPQEFGDLPQTVSSQTISQTKSVTEVTATTTPEITPAQPKS